MGIYYGEAREGEQVERAGIANTMSVWVNDTSENVV